MRSLVGYCKLRGRTSAEVSPAGGWDLDQIVACTGFASPYAFAAAERSGRRI
jgi:hypothetical protein